MKLTPGIFFPLGFGDKSNHIDQRRKDLGSGGEKWIRGGLQLILRQHQHLRAPLCPQDGRQAHVLHVHLLRNDGPASPAPN